MIDYEKQEIKFDTWATIVVCVVSAVAGLAGVFIEGCPMFHHGLLIAMGLIGPLLSRWRYRALIAEIDLRRQQNTY